LLNSREKNDQALFDNIAESYAKKDFIHYCREARKQRLLQSIQNLEKPVGSILEIGCGAGFTAEYLKDYYHSYTGLDYSENLINFAQQHHRDKRIEFICSSLDAFETSNRFDAIVLIGVLHHMPQPEKALQQIKHLLKETGTVIVNEPAKNNLMVRLLRYIRKKTDSDYSSDQVEFSCEELKVMFESQGLQPTVYFQGIFSTPFAETTFLPGWLAEPFALLACKLDRFLEKNTPKNLLKFLSWNVVVQGRIQTTRH